MRRSHLIAWVLAGGLIMLAPCVGGQTLEAPRRRQGYYASLGVKGLVSAIREDGESLGTWAGFSNNLRLGQLLTRRFGLGLSIDVGGSSGDGQTASLFGLGVEAQWELGRNVALRGGVGLAAVSIAEAAKPDADLRGTYGAGYWLGASWDWFPFGKRLTGGFALTPVAELRVIPENGLQAFAGIFGVEISWWTGLPRNQLELPPDEAFKPH